MGGMGQLQVHSGAGQSINGGNDLQLFDLDVKGREVQKALTSDGLLRIVGSQHRTKVSR